MARGRAATAAGRLARLAAGETTTAAGTMASSSSSSSSLSSSASFARAFGSLFGSRAANVASAYGAKMPTSAFPFQARSVSLAALKPSDEFSPRHNSLTAAEEAEMVAALGFASLDDLIDATVPASIRADKPLDLGEYTEGYTESEFLEKFKAMASRNQVLKSFIGMGYYGTHLPPVIQRNVLENPGWYTQYTPYQAEIAQGRLEALLTFQTAVTDLTGMQISNASLLDEATAAAEAMTMCSALARGKKTTFLVSDACHPQTIEVCKTRADGLGLKVVVAKEAEFVSSGLLKPGGGGDVCGVLVQYPGTDGTVPKGGHKATVEAAHAAKAKVCVATDLLALTKLAPPGEWGADIVVGSAQRFGVPMGYGGPHAAFLACHDEYKRLMPGRIIGVSRDAAGNPCLRMAMQTREQHIRRDKATSNICTAQALLANIAGLYAVYHGPEGLTRIADRVHGLAATFAAAAAKAAGLSVPSASASASFFDTVSVVVSDSAEEARKRAVAAGYNVRVLDAKTVSVAFDETSALADVDALVDALAGKANAAGIKAADLAASVDAEASIGEHARSSPFLEHSVFNSYHSEHEMLRYLKKLENRDLSLCHSMIPLGSCTMKLNASTEMMPVTWPELANLHPFAPRDQAEGYQEMFEHLAAQLAEITGFDAVSLQPNSGASGEYAGLMAIRAYHKANGDEHRNVCIIPVSAHGTNPASAVMAGMDVVVVPVDAKGNIDIPALEAAAVKHRDRLAALMITYPSTHGVYEEGVDRICDIVHENGGQVYMDGANMNAQVGLTSPGRIGADVCHLNLHKTFCIPHGGGGPGMGPIGIKKHLAPHMPTHPVVPTGALPNFKTDKDSFGTMAAAPYGSSLILPISYAYISMMGSKGLERASKLAILNANYMAKRLEKHFPVLFRGPRGTCAHEFIIDLRPLKETADVEAEDIAKRLIDYGYHAPTMSWPVSGTLMIEPTESESKAELDRFCDALISIREEIRQVENGAASKHDNVLKRAPHTAEAVLSSRWDRPYSREAAAFPAPWVQQAKFWPTTSRVDNVWGDRHLVARLPEGGMDAAKARAAAGGGSGDEGGVEAAAA